MLLSLSICLDAMIKQQSYLSFAGYSQQWDNYNIIRLFFICSQ
ncbi:glycosyltransferase [Bacillus thuringiensis]|nr:glycosyltransferase [Bacillus thuringiensis]